MNGTSAPPLSVWLDEQIARGCSAVSMVDAMVDAGHARRDAQQAVEQAVSKTGPSTVASPEHNLAAPNSQRIGDSEIQVLFGMVAPRIILFGQFLSLEECDALVRASSDKIRPSLVVDPDSGEFHTDAVRSSEGTHFEHAENRVVAAVEQRIENLLGFRLAQQEAMQILRYRVGGEYEPHFDYFDPASPGSKIPLATGGQRIATLVMYLNDVVAGGATIFPRLGIEVKPRKGNAVYFESCDGAGNLDPRTLHGGAPVAAGEKWIATKWIRERDIA